MTHSIEFLKNARNIGATHLRNRGEIYKVSNDSVYYYSLGGWFSCADGCDIDGWIIELKAIDYSPLDDYQQDKALDIAATGIAE